MYGLLVAPLIWSVQLYLNYGLASHACFPDRTPRASFLPGWEQLWVVLLLVNLVCVVICAIGLLSSGYSWRRLRNPPAIAAEADNQPADTSEERLRSFAVSGLMVTGVFMAAILFNTIFLWALSTCSQA